LSSAIEQIDRDLQQGVLTDDEIIFRRYAGAFYDAFTRQGDIARLAVLVIHTHPEIARIIAKRIIEGRKVITQYVKKRQDEGYFRKDIDPAFFVQVMAMIFIMRAVGQGLYDFLPFAHLSREEVIDQIVSLLLHGITQHDSSCHT
jgi:TetR/AcrR family transcriptional regulator